MSDVVLLERIGAVGKITLNRPDVGNAIDIRLARALMEMVVSCEQDEGVRCVVITGSGRLFCAGGDVSAFADSADELPTHLSEITTYVHAAVSRLMRMPKPVITAINGPVAGAGIGLALVGDIALASSVAHFTLAYTAIGMSPDGGATWLLPRLVGLRRAQELCLRNERVSAQQAMAMGMVSRVVDEAVLEEQTTLIAEELASGATSALGATRRLLLDGMTATLEAHLEAESRSIIAQGRSPNGKEGIAAFIAKRQPRFVAGR